MKSRALGLVSQDSLVSQGWQMKTTTKNVVMQNNCIRYENGQKKSIKSELYNGIFMSTFRGMDILKI